MAETDGAVDLLGCGSAAIREVAGGFRQMMTTLRTAVASGWIVLFLLSATVSQGQEKRSPVKASDAESIVAAKFDLFGDPLPPGAASRLGTLRFRSRTPVEVLALSPDGKTLAAAGGREVSLLELATGKKVASFREDQYSFLLAFAEGGKTLISVDERGTVRCRNVANGQEVHRFRAVKDDKEFDNEGALTPDGRFLAIKETDQGVICLWDLTARRPVRRFQSAKYEGGPIAIARDGQTLAAGASGRIVVWDVASGNEQRSFTFKPSAMSDISFSPNGKVLICTGPGCTPTHVWDVRTGETLRTYGPAPLEASGHAFSSDGKLLATVHMDPTDNLRVWDLATHKEKQCWSADTLGIHPRLLFTPDGKTLITAGSGPVIRFWDVNSGKELTTEPKGPPRHLLASPDGRFLVSSSSADKTLLWDLKSCKQVCRFEGASWSGVVAFTPDSRHLAYTDRDDGVCLCEASSGKEIRRFPGHDKGVTALAFSEDGERLFTAHEDASFRVCRVADGQELRWRPLAQPSDNDPQSGRRILPFFFRDARVLMTTFHDGMAYRLWDTSNGQRLHGPHDCKGDFSSQIAIAPDGRSFAAWAWDQSGSLSLYEMPTGGLRLSLRSAPEGREGYGFSGILAFSPDSRLLAASSADGKAIDVWDVRTGKRVHAIEVVQGRLTGLTFVGNGDLLATGGNDTTILLWDVAHVRRKLGLRPHHPR
ncbi:MAG TPA: WD40 repeat domain-containing protein, partial [Gemmataceae bacterium]|nr:WD40 repeat domain-containing protein [Gemmataceae bacterium]